MNQVMANPERLSKTAERVVEDFCWVQWDIHTQRLYYLTHNAAHAQARTTVASMIYVKAQKSFLMTGAEDTSSKQMSLCQDKFVLRCVQFYLNQICDTVVSPVSVTIISALSAFRSRCRDHRATRSSHWILSFIKLSSPQLELPLELPSNPFRTVRYGRVNAKICFLSRLCLKLLICVAPAIKDPEGVPLHRRCGLQSFYFAKYPL